MDGTFKVPSNKKTENRKKTKQVHTARTKGSRARSTSVRYSAMRRSITQLQSMEGWMRVLRVRHQPGAKHHFDRRCSWLEPEDTVSPVATTVVDCRASSSSELLMVMRLGVPSASNCMGSPGREASMLAEKRWGTLLPGLEPSFSRREGVRPEPPVVGPEAVGLLGAEEVSLKCVGMRFGLEDRSRAAIISAGSAWASARLSSSASLSCSEPGAAMFDRYHA